mmetsp:Transcript_9633/g.26652  ORF Transcript_9633/g.26652 Transcript_9633/m.26652 type:complete len:132 (+) Transcript_9633:1955-2350(+)
MNLFKWRSFWMTNRSHLHRVGHLRHPRPRGTRSNNKTSIQEVWLHPKPFGSFNARVHASLMLALRERISRHKALWEGDFRHERPSGLLLANPVVSTSKVACHQLRHRIHPVFESLPLAEKWIGMELQNVQQ